MKFSSLNLFIQTKNTGIITLPVYGVYYSYNYSNAHFKTHDDKKNNSENALS